MRCRLRWGDELCAVGGDGGLGCEVMVEVAVCFLSASEEVALTGPAASVGCHLSALRCDLYASLGLLRY